MMVHGPLIETLLAGAFVCSVSDPENFRRLQDESQRDAIDAYLQPLNRRLVSSQDAAVYFLGYLEYDEDARVNVSQQLSQTVQSLLPLLEWMQLVQEALGRDGAISAGDTVKVQEFVLKTEDNPSLRHRLQQLAN